MAAKDPYKLLGVPKTATEDEIRKAYRKLAKKHHPDVNQGDKASETKFKEITAAYNLLSNKELRQQYDSGQVDASGQQQNPFAGGFGGFGQGGAGGAGGPGGSQGGGFEGFRRSSFSGPGDFDEMSDLFSSLFGMNMGARGGGAQRGGFSGRARPQKGADIRYKLTLSMKDALKGGTKKVRMGDGKTLNVKIPKGVEDGTTLRLRGKGQAGAGGGPAGDARIEITVKPDKNIVREGNNLRVTLPISLQLAVLGGKVKVPVPTGKVQITIPPGTNSGKTFRLKGKGIKDGDLLATTQIMLDDPKDPDLVQWATAHSADSPLKTDKATA